MVGVIAVQLVVGMLVILAGVAVNASRKHAGLRQCIETYILGGGDLFDEKAGYARVVRWAGWRSLVLGIAIAIPLPLLWDMVLLAISISVMVWIGLKVRGEYRKARAVAELESESTV